MGEGETEDLDITALRLGICSRRKGGFLLIASKENWM